MKKCGLWVFVFLVFLNGFSFAGDLPLELILERVIDNDLDLKIQEAKIKGARARHEHSWRAFLPSLSLRGERIYNSQEGTRRLTTQEELDNLSANELGIRPVQAYRVLMTYQMPIFDPKMPMDLKISSAGLAIEELGLEQEKMDRRLLATQQYYELFKAQQMSEVLDAHLERYSIYLEEVKNKQALNLMTKEEILEVESQLNEQKTAVFTNRYEARSLVMQLNTMMRDGYLLNEFAAVIPELKVAMPNLDLGFVLGSVSEAYKNRYDLKQMEMEEKQLTFQIRRIKRENDIVLSASVNYGFTDRDGFVTRERTEDGSYTIGAQMLLFDGFRIESRVAELKSRREEKRLEIEKKKFEIKSEITQHFYAMKLAHETYHHLDTLISYRQEQLDSAQGKAELKKATGLDVFNASVELRAARVDQIAAQVDFLLAQVAFRVAMGRS